MISSLAKWQPSKPLAARWVMVKRGTGGKTIPSILDGKVTTAWQVNNRWAIAWPGNGGWVIVVSTMAWGQLLVGQWCIGDSEQGKNSVWDDGGQGDNMRGKVGVTVHEMIAGRWWCGSLMGRLSTMAKGWARIAKSGIWLYKSGLIGSNIMLNNNEEKIKIQTIQNA